MREIKFRALGTDGHWWFGEIKPSGEYHVNLATFFPNLCRSLDISTMGEYTGLKDKNGKEIYEGDIVIHDCTLFPKIELRRWVVVYRDACFKLKHILQHAFPPLVGQLVEVIGNIYENPELLEVK